MTDLAALDDVLHDVELERCRQDAKWGEQNHPDGTSKRWWSPDRDVARGTTDEHARLGTCTWLDILREEVFEVFAEESPEKLRAELIQVAAVAVVWIQAIDRRSA